MRTRWPILALLCVLASLLVPETASASTASGAENRVGAFDLAEQVHVAGAATLTPDLHQAYALAEYDSASDSLLAARGGAKYGATPKGRPLTKHYGTETGPKRNIPGSVVDNTIDTTPGVPGRNGTTVHYDPVNNVTVVTGDGGSIVSAHKGKP